MSAKVVDFSSFPEGYQSRYGPVTFVELPEFMMKDHVVISSVRAKAIIESGSGCFLRRIGHKLCVHRLHAAELVPQDELVRSGWEIVPRTVERKRGKK
jgi:hypothetical protein